MNPIINGKIPFIDQFSSMEEAFNFMAKKLNSSFSSDDRFLVTGSFSNTAGAPADISVTFSHPFKSTPTAVIICNCISGNYYYNNFMPSYRVSNLTDSFVTITMKQAASSSDTFSFLIFR